MVGPRAGEVGYFERSRSRFIIPASGGLPAFEMYECEAERGQLRNAPRGVRLFSGPPPRGWGARLEGFAEDDGAMRVHEALSALAAEWGEGLRLYYSALVSHRRTVGCCSLASPVRTSASWALTGWLRPEGMGRSIPIGWSGRGAGLDWLQAGAGQELEVLLKGLERAQPLTESSSRVVLAPPAAAVLLHEAIGHLAEGPAEVPVRSTSLLGHRVASECLSLEDDPLVPGGPVHYEYDDENVRSLGPTRLVERGVLVASLHSQQSAREAGDLPTANARAASSWALPIPRMSNLLCTPGEAAEEELIEHAGEGLFIRRLANGINNGAALQADIVLAERIQRGKLTGQFFTGGRMKERAGVLLRTVEVGNNAAFHSNALCGKAGQLLFTVGTRAPSLRLSSLRLVA